MPRSGDQLLHRTSALRAHHKSALRKVNSSCARFLPKTYARATSLRSDGEEVSGIRTNAAAELLGVSPNTLRSGERRFPYPKPRRTQGGHRQYDFAELESLRRALLETHNISSAIELARQRGEGPSSPSRMLDAWDHFDEVLAIACWRRAWPRARCSARSRKCCSRRSSWPTSVRGARPSESWPSAGPPAGCMPRAGWCRPPAAPRASCCSTRARGSTSTRCTCRRSSSGCGARASHPMLAFDMPPERVVRAIRALDPTAFVFWAARPPSRWWAASCTRSARSVGGAGVRVPRGDAGQRRSRYSLSGHAPGEAVERLKGYVDNGRPDQVLTVPEPVVEPRTGRVTLAASKRAG